MKFDENYQEFKFTVVSARIGRPKHCADPSPTVPTENKYYSIATMAGTGCNSSSEGQKCYACICS